MATNRCGYIPNVRGDPDYGRVSCWRPTYRDSDRCIWHTDSGKSAFELAQYDPAPGERLDGAVLRGLDFRGIQWLTGCILIGADFTDANVSGADFSDTDLRKSAFEDATAQRTNFRGANLERATVCDADLRGADLEMARLDGTNLTGSRITEKTVLGDRVVYELEMKEQTNRYAKEDALENATRTYGKLEQLSEDNSLNRQASQYYRKAKDIRRRFNWQTNSYLSAMIAEVSRLFTGYGNRPWRVILTSVTLILLAGLIYPVVGGLHRTAARPDVLRPITDISQVTFSDSGISLLNSIYFSIVTFTTLGYGNFEPNTVVGRYVAGAEALIGTVLLALLVAVLTRSTWLR